MGDCMDMDDDAFLDAFERGALQDHGFGHRDHLRMAWLYVRRYGPDQAAGRAEAGLRNLAALHGHPERYSATRTAVWVALVGHHLAEAPGLGFDAFLKRFPRLLDGRLLEAHYSPGLLASDDSRVRRVGPDRLPLPAGVC
jgi:N-formylglutamate deformylase